MFTICLWPRAGIGRQSGLKIQWDLLPWRFESARGYQKKIIDFNNHQKYFLNFLNFRKYVSEFNRRRPTLPSLKTKYHRRWRPSRPSSKWDRVFSLRYDRHKLFITF